MEDGKFFPLEGENFSNLTFKQFLRILKNFKGVAIISLPL
jgi:hypothetical protein